MRVGTEAADSTLENAASMHSMFGLSQLQAAQSIASVCAVVSTWKQHFRACGVSKRDIELTAEQVDRPFLKDQHDAALSALAKTKRARIPR
jgi:serine/threonine-protein kinase HipA